MTLIDKGTYRQIIGSLMRNTFLLVQYDDIEPSDFGERCAQTAFIAIKNLYQAGAQQLTASEVEQEIEKHERSYLYYVENNGREFLTTCYELANPSNFETYYNQLKKCSLLRELQREHYDISEFFIDDKDVVNPLEAAKVQEHCEQSSLEDILDSIESKYSIIRNKFLHGGKSQGDPSEKINELIERLKEMPNVGEPLEGKLFNAACRGARVGCFYLKSSSSGSGKTRTSVFDACKLTFPIKWSHTMRDFIMETPINNEDVMRDPVKTLFIVTEMDKEELQTIMLAYLSGVPEDRILTGSYLDDEYERVLFAAQIIKDYHDNFIIEEISEPNLVNVTATIKRYATVENVKYVFFDYIHSTASMMSEFAKTGLREDE